MRYIRFVIITRIQFKDVTFFAQNRKKYLRNLIVSEILMLYFFVKKVKVSSLAMKTSLLGTLLNVYC